MKYRRMITGLLLLAVLCLMLSGCGTFQVQMAKTTTRMAKLDNFHADVEAYAETRMNIGGQKIRMDAVVTGGFDMALDPLLIKTDLHLSTLGVERDLRLYIQKEYDTWTPEEFARFAEAVHNPVYRSFFTFMYYTGTRRGEAMAVRASDIDPDAMTVRIEHQIKYAEEGFLSLKTDSSARVLRLPEKLWSAIRPLYERCTEDAPFLFGGERCLAITSIQREFTKGIKASGVKAIRLHDLRHSHATWLINNGVNIVAVSKRLGHSNVNQTLKTYTHLLQDSDDRLMDTINAAVSEIPW